MVYLRCGGRLELLRRCGVSRRSAPIGTADACETSSPGCRVLAEEYRLLLERLGDDVLRKWGRSLRMEGETTEAIAGKLGCARRTVARQLALIRRILDCQPV